MKHESDVKKVFDLPDYLIKSADRVAVRSELVSGFLGDIQGNEILDLGCGDGSLSVNYICTNRVTFVDFSQTMLDHAKNKIPKECLINATFVNEAISSLEIAKKYDVVICIGLIAHVESVDILFDKIVNLLKPGGKLIIETTPNPFPLGKIFFPYYWVRNKLRRVNFEYKKNRMQISDLNERLVKAGLKLQEHKRYCIQLPSFSHWSPPLKLWFTRMTLTNRTLSRFGSEHIFIYTSPEQNLG